MEINSRPRGRHLARRFRSSETGSSAVTWEPSDVVKAHTGSIPVLSEDPRSRVARLREIRDRMAEPDPA
ncbi:hypothetical protein LWF15_11975 [Kineosporia rhizophila]|uniref:hypothetical protein n=1 Tax=Kineosporia TaxID=49184 RepID=UPI000AAEA5D3|nr:MULTISPECIES: hypothetical protein [Kineosporia]MCE0536226.1 hypothetical protein [Kineosporia rhizophila]GLY15187.1 hypothetical protein Kisp01_22020 [Kineosporia sp. NBRC 101677]